MKLSKYLVYTFIGIITLSSCKQNNADKFVKTEEVTFTKEGTLSLYKVDSTFIKTIDLEIADDDYQRETGLMHRNSMKDSQGMLFIFPEENLRSFYMKNTLIPLDIIYLNAQGKIVSFAENAQPLDETSLPSQVPAQYVLELNAGMAEELLLEIGDYIKWKRD